MAFSFIKSDISQVNEHWRSLHVNDYNCTIQSIEEYLDWFTAKPPRYDFIFICLLLCLYLFLALAIVCDEYCIPSVEKICNGLGMSTHVAGATLLAGATSAPEFFCNTYATLLTKGDMGIGTIVGSSVFNSLGISAICGLSSGKQGICLDWWPITRDILWYSASIVLLTTFMFDKKIIWYESLVLVLVFIANMIFLILDPQLQRIRKSERQCPCICYVPPNGTKDIQDVSHNDAEGEEEEEEPFNFRRWPPTHFGRFLWILNYPIQCLFFITIPNIRRRITHKCAVLCLIMSVAWIGVLTYLICWMLTVIGFNIFVPDSVMGLTLLAMGTSIPEAVSSFIVVRKGYGSMAVCNAIGSNSFNILFCLGLPWLIKSLIYIKDSKLNIVKIHSGELYFAAAILLLSAIFMYTTLMMARFRLSITVGAIYAVVYLAYITVAVLLEIMYKEATSLCPVHFKNN